MGDFLLHIGEMPEGHRISKIAPCDDDHVCERYDLLYCCKPFGVLYFGKETASAGAALLHGLSDFPQICRAAHKGLHDVGDAIRFRILKIQNVLLCQCVSGDCPSLHRNALAA